MSVTHKETKKQTVVVTQLRSVSVFGGRRVKRVRLKG